MIFIQVRQDNLKMTEKWQYLCFPLCLLTFTQAGKIPVDGPTQNSTPVEQPESWNEKKTREFNKQLEAEENHLQQTQAYAAIMDLIAKPGCGIEAMNVTEQPGSVLLTALGTSTLLVAKGCPDRALEAVRVLTEALSGTLVNPIDVRDKTQCSSEAEKAMRILLSDYPRLKHLYFMMATGVYGASGCKHLVAKVLPALVRYVTQLSEMRMPMQSFPESCSDDDVIFTSTQEMEQVYKHLQVDGKLPDEQQQDRKKRSSECPSMATEVVGTLVDVIPVVGPIHSAVSLGRNIYRGCVNNVIFGLGKLALNLVLG